MVCARYYFVDKDFVCAMLSDRNNLSLALVSDFRSLHSEDGADAAWVSTSRLTEEGSGAYNIILINAPSDLAISLSLA